ncbi:MAG: AMP-binding protein [Coriobacteriales bacterium]|jgi:acetyl-CoA synthetase|nr:AMP-binding protein [Coriobacteriales bacterium]
MNHILKQYCPRIDFTSYEDFFENFRIDVPADFNFAYDVVDEWARVEPDKRALVWCDDADDERILTFTDVSRLSDRLANALWDIGLRKGDIVMVALRQRWEYWVTATALCKLGAIVIPATTQLTQKDIVYRLNASGAKAVIALDDEYVRAQMELALPSCPEIEWRILVNGTPAEGAAAAGAPAVEGSGENIGGDAAGTSAGGSARPETDGWLSFERMLAGASEDWTRPTGEAATRNDDIMLIYFTSGTTGPAKMCEHNFVHPLGHIITAKYWQQVQENRLHCSVSDSGWAKFGWGKIYGQWIAGATVFAYDAIRFNPLELLRRIERYQVCTFCVPPTMYRFMLQEDLSSIDLSSVENYTTAGEPLNADVTKRWYETTGKMIREGFGQSEGPVLLATFPWVEPRPGSMGRPSPLLNIQLLDAEGAPVADGDEGSICVTRLKEAYPPGLFVGYYRNPEATETAVGGTHYDLHDVAWRDPDGYYTFVGRNDDVIKCSGYRIGPFEVESALVAHPAVLECAVTAAPDEVRGSVVKASIVLARGLTPSDALAHELQEHVKTTTAPYKYPRIVEFVDELPKTIGGKIKRAQIRTLDEGGSWEE